MGCSTAEDLNPFHGNREDDWLGEDIGGVVNSVASGIGDTTRGFANLATGGLYNVVGGGSWRGGLEDSTKDFFTLGQYDNIKEAFSLPEYMAGPAQEQQRALARAGWKRYQDAFIPLEDQLLATVFNPAYRKEQAMNAYTASQEGQDRFQDAAERTRRGYGLTLDGREEDAIERATDFSRSKNRVSAYNNALRVAQDRETRVLGGGLTGIPQLDMGGRG